MGKAIYFLSYGISVVVIFIAKHVRQGIVAARMRGEATPSIQALEDDVTEGLLLDLEKVIIDMISAARANDLHRLREREEEHLAILKTLQVEGTWSNERISKYLTDRGWGDLSGPNFHVLRSKIGDLASSVVSNDRRSPEYLAKFLDKEISNWSQIIKTAGIEPIETTGSWRLRLAFGRCSRRPGCAGLITGKEIA